VAVLWAGGLGFIFQQGQAIFLFAEASRLDPNEPLFSG